ncbi:MAG: CehA/McbA family metallohydrolase [Planctomycetaceae bacterium]
MISVSYQDQLRLARWLFGSLVLMAAAGCESKTDPDPDNETVSAPVNAPDVGSQVESSVLDQSSSPDRLEIVQGVDRQPLMSQARRLIEAMDFAGSPLSKADVDALNAAMSVESDAESIASLQRILNTYTLVDVHINPEARVKVSRGECDARLQQQGWRVFLVRVHNEPRVTARLEINSRNSQPTMDFAKEGAISSSEVEERWMKVEMLDKKPLNPRLSGLPVEYRIVTVFSRDAGEREGHMAFNIGQGTQDIGFRNDLHVLFECQPAVSVVFHIKDHDGTPATGSLVIQDEKEQLYPLPARRTAPDFFFQEQIYRASGESVMLPAGRYNITYGRGPEYLRETKSVDVPDAGSHPVELQLTRWIDPEARGWISGDHHIHASGCLHYQSPAIGVEAPVMLRHIQGEGLNIGNVLTWGPGWEYQKNNFCGVADEVSTDQNVIRYDVEVSQFPSDHTGHLCLLGLSEDDYPGTSAKSEWPSWGLPIVKWAKEQGAVTGAAHSGWGLDVFPEARLPNYVIPPMDGIGAQESLVHAAHDAVDFLSTIDTPHVWELNFWYHMMNCGFAVKASGETDFPCIYGERVGLGRSYVKLDDAAKISYPDWVRGVQAGRSYVSDGSSHIMDFTVNDVEPGNAEGSIAKIDEPKSVHVTATVAALLDEEPRTVFAGEGNWDTLVKGELLRTNREQIPIRDLPYSAKPYWHLERARIGDTRHVMLELVVNGEAVDQQEILADGSEIPVSFDVEIERSSWVALRILAASHTNPVIVQVDEQPVRASKLSAEWCLDSLDQLWLQKAMNIRVEERMDAHEAYGVARTVYKAIAEESWDDTALLAGADAELRQQQHLDIQDNMEVIEFAISHNNGEYGKVTFDRTIRGFTGEIDLHVTAEPAVAQIHYTLDGSRVTGDSPIYEGPIKLSETVTVSARGFIEGKICTNMAKATYTQFTPEDFGEGVSPGVTQQGLNYRYYHGDYAGVDSVKEADLVSEFIAPNFNIDVRERDLFYALHFSGLIDIPQDGVYMFATSSNDGSRLYIGDTLVVDNDGVHGIRSASGMIPMKAGLHPIRVNYFNAGGTWALDVTWKGPDFDEQPIPENVLHRKPLASIEP